MWISEEIKEKCKIGLEKIYAKSIDSNVLSINDTKAEYEGEYTLICFALSKVLGEKPESIGEKLGQYLLENNVVKNFNIVKGFLNLSLKDAYYTNFLFNSFEKKDFSTEEKLNKKIMVEYSSPNTNKPIHFGHLRNIFLGDAISNIYDSTGYKVCRANLINDRGIHICKSMLAWQMFANGATPQSTNIKGDHFVGDYYVKFNNVYKEEIKTLVLDGKTEKEAEREAPIFIKAQEMLRAWEAGDEEIVSLWKTMNGWVYEGFEKTYKELGIHFNRMYYESNTYLLGKKEIEEGLRQNVFYKKEDGSVWINLEEDGLDEKLVLRADGTSVYITQDIGTAQLKYDDEKMDQSVYVIADEQNYHMKVLQLILKKLQKPFADGVVHLSYGMVELPHGKMKSRDGTVVDADDIIEEMKNVAKKNTESLGKVSDFSEQELNSLYYTLGLGALKFYLLRMDPKKIMVFNPEESIDFHGYTGPFIQYTHARLSSILRKSEIKKIAIQSELLHAELFIISLMEKLPSVLQQTAKDFNTAHLCQYLFHLAKNMNSFLSEYKILQAESEEKMYLRLMIANTCKNILNFGLQQLGINAPERM